MMINKQNLNDLIKKRDRILEMAIKKFIKKILNYLKNYHITNPVRL